MCDLTFAKEFDRLIYIRIVLAETQVMLNTACSGKFSSDRTIEEYAKEIWNLKKVKVTLD